MRAWPPGDRESATNDAEETLRELEARGIDLNPATHRHDDPDLPEGHQHPHIHSSEGETPIIGIVGGGSVGPALGSALVRAGWPVQAIASRDAARRARFQALVPGARAFAEATALLDEVELVILAVPDDALAGLARTLRLYSGQALVHTSGALGADVLEPARAAGTQVGSFHPLVAFADPTLSVEALVGSTIAIEGDDQLAALLAGMAEAIGGTAVRLAPGTKSAYHAAAVLAAGGFIALLDAIAELGAVVGLDEAGSLDVYGRLSEQTLANARALGLVRALTGPIARGDVGTLTAHLATLRSQAPTTLALYQAAAGREIDLAERRGALAPDVVETMRRALAGGA